MNGPRMAWVTWALGIREIKWQTALAVSMTKRSLGDRRYVSIKFKKIPTSSPSSTTLIIDLQDSKEKKEGQKEKFSTYFYSFPSRILTSSQCNLHKDWAQSQDYYFAVTLLLTYDHGLSLDWVERKHGIVWWDVSGE